MRNARQQRVLVVATYRTDELHRRHPLRAFLAEADRVRSVSASTCERFTREELAEQLTGILGAAPTRAWSTSCSPAPRATRSSPRSWPPRAGRRRGLPDNVADALMLRIEG